MNIRGFSPEMRDFLFKLQFENTFARTEELKPEYKKYITEPLKQLYEAVAPTIAELDEELSTRPAKCVSSPYTDRRFSPEMPFKDYGYLRFRLPGDEYDIIGFYFDVGLDGYAYGVRIYYQTTGGMRKIRDYCLSHRAEAVKALRAVKGFNILGKSYVKDHFPDEKGALKNFLNMRTVRVCVEKPLSEEIFSSSFADTLKASFIKLEPFYRLIKNAAKQC